MPDRLERSWRADGRWHGGETISALLLSSGSRRAIMREGAAGERCFIVGIRRGDKRMYDIALMVGPHRHGWHLAGIFSASSPKIRLRMVPYHNINEISVQIKIPLSLYRCVCISLG